MIDIGLCISFLSVPIFLSSPFLFHCPHPYPHDEPPGIMMVTRSGIVAALVALTLLLAVPLWQLSDHASAEYYTQQAKDFGQHAKDFFYDNVSKYWTHSQEVYNNTLYQDGTEDEVHAQYNFSTPCDGFPNTDGILLVMKTGATEAYSKMPTQLLTAMSCLPDFLLYSDLVCSNAGLPQFQLPDFS